MIASTSKTSNAAPAPTEPVDTHTLERVRRGLAGLDVPAARTSADIRTDTGASPLPRRR